MYHLRKMVIDNDLKDDRGETFIIDTHLFRHSYGKRLAEMEVDDITVAKLLGHSGTKSVHHYRKLSNKYMAEKAKPVLDELDEVLNKYTKGWE